MSQAHEMVLCLDEKTSLQPRPRQAATLAPKPHSTLKVEHEYERKGALNLFAAFDTRTGKVWGQTYERKRQAEFPPVHCSWMNQLEQWFSILQRKRLKIANFKDKQALAEPLQAFIDEWNAHAHPFNWTTKSVAKIMAKCDSKPTRAMAA